MVAHSDTTPTRFMLALCATIWALMLLAPGDTFDRPVYRYMAQVAGNHAEEKWTALFSLYAAGLYWRIFSSVSRPKWAFAIHTLGVVLFTSSAVAIMLTRADPLPAAVSSDFVVAMAAFWVLVRTQVNQRDGWRND